MKITAILPLSILVILTSPAGVQEQPRVSAELQPVIAALDKTATDMVKDPQAASFKQIIP